MSFAEGMKAMRKRLGLTQMDLVRLSGVPQSTVSAVESGVRVPTEDTMTAIAKGLNCTVGELLGEIKKSPPSEDDEERQAGEALLRRLRGDTLKEAVSYLRWKQSEQENL